MIRCEFQGKKVWRVIADLACIGDYTNADGPRLDDEFLVFVNCGLWYEASPYFDGGDQTMETVGRALNCLLHLG